MPGRSWKWRDGRARRFSQSRTITLAASAASLLRHRPLLAAPVTVESLGVRRLPKSGRTADDVLAYVGLSVSEIAAAAERLARRDGASPPSGVGETMIASR